MYCLHCQKEYKKELFCPECGRMLVDDNTFNYEKNETNCKNYMEEELVKEKQRIKQEQEKIRQQDKQTNKPQCPTCHSYNVRPISGLSRANSVFAWGLFSSKLGKTYECLNCKYKW